MSSVDMHGYENIHYRSLVNMLRSNIEEVYLGVQQCFGVVYYHELLFLVLWTFSKIQKTITGYPEQNCPFYLRCWPTHSHWAR